MIIIVISLEIELHPMPQKTKSQSTKFERTQDYKEKALQKFHLTTGKRLLDIPSCWKFQRTAHFWAKVSSERNISQLNHVFRVPFLPACLVYPHALRGHVFKFMSSLLCSLYFIWSFWMRNRLERSWSGCCTNIYWGEHFRDCLTKHKLMPDIETLFIELNVRKRKWLSAKLVIHHL